MKKGILPIFLFFLFLGAAIGLCAFLNLRTPVLHSGEILPQEIASRPYELEGARFVSEENGFEFIFFKEGNPGADDRALELVLSDSGAFELVWNGETHAYRPASAYRRNVSVFLPGVADGMNRLLIRLPAGQHKRLLSGPEFRVKLLLGTPAAVEKTRHLFRAADAFILGLYIMLILSSLALYLAQPKEKYLVALMVTAAAVMAVSLIDHSATGFGVTLGMFSFIRSSLFIFPSVLTAAIVFYLLREALNPALTRLLTLRNVLITAGAVAFVQLFSTYNFNYLLRIALSLALLPVLYRSAAQKPTETCLLAIGYGFSEGSRWFIYFTNTHSIWHAGAAGIFLRFTQTGYLVQLLLCMAVVLRNFAMKFNEADEVVRLLDRRVAERTAELQVATEEALRAKNSEHEVMVNILHDLRTPLFHLQGCLDMFPEVPADAGAALAVMRDRVEYLQSLVESSFLAAKLKDGAITWHFHETDLAQLLRYVVDSVSRSAACRTEIHLTAPDSFPIVTDGLRCRQVLENLVNNAVRYATKGTAIHIELQPNGDGALLTIRNQTDSLRAEDIATLFDRFSHGKQSGSTGLGLYIARQLANGMGGSLEAYLEDGSVAFRFAVPRHEESEEESGATAV